MRKPRVGFVLVETIVIITILGLLSVGVALGVNKQLSKARDAQRKLEIKKLGKALEEYYDSSLCYPQVIPQCGEKLFLNGTVLLDTVPCDPLSQKPYRYVTDMNPVCNTLFKLYANLENTEDTDIKYLGCTYGCGPSCSYNYGGSSTNTRLDGCEPSPTPSGIPSVTPTASVTMTPSPTPDINQYVCAPGIGNEGHCTVFTFPELSDCPQIWTGDPTCQNQCNIKQNHCKNSKGKKP